MSRYIPLNPTKDGLTEKPEDYKWSSYPILIEEISPIKPRFYSRFEKKLIKEIVDKDEFFKRFFPEYEKKRKKRLGFSKNLLTKAIRKKFGEIKNGETTM